MSKPRKKKRFNYKFSYGPADQPPRLNPAELLLEHISGADLAKSRSHATTLATYHKKLFYELEGQRAAHADEIRSALQSVTSLTVSVNDWCRQVKSLYALAPLSCKGSLKISGRFNYGNDLDIRFPRFPALYIAENRATAHCEMFQIRSELTGRLTAADINFQPGTSIAAYALQGTVNQVFDLTSATCLNAFLDVTRKFKLSSELRRMETTFNIAKRDVAQSPDKLMMTLLDPGWRAYVMYADLPANSQVFGALLQDAGFEGVLYPSVRSQGGKALAIFPRCLKNSPSLVRVSGYPPGAQCVEASAKTYMDLE